MDYNRPGKEYSIHLVILYPRQDNGRGFPEDYQIDVSSDNETWETVYTKTEDKGSEDEDVDPREIELGSFSKIHKIAGHKTHGCSRYK